MSATDGDDEGVLDDLGMPPWWHFVGGGAAIGLGVMAFRHLTLLVPAVLLFAVLALLERRGGYRIKDRHREIRRHTPRPNVVLDVAGFMSVPVGVLLVSGVTSWVPSEALPTWAAVVVAVVVGAVAAVWGWKHQRLRVLTARRLRTDPSAEDDP